MAWHDEIAKASYPGRSPDTAEFAILGICGPSFDHHHAEAHGDA